MNGIIRVMDNLGRIVVPIEMRSRLHFSENQALKIELEEDKIILTKSKGACDLCGSEENPITCGEYTLCRVCYKKITKGMVPEGLL